MKKQHHHLMPPEKIFLYTGIGILLIALVYLVIDKDRAHATSQLWIPFVLAIVALALTTRFVR